MQSAKCTLTAAGQIADYPILIADTADRINLLAIDVSTAAGSGGSVDVGIRADSGSGTPGTLLQDAGAISTTTTGAISSSAFSTLTLSRGLYWIEVENVALGSSNAVVWGITATFNNLLIAQVLGGGTAAPLLNGSIGYAVVSSTTATGALSSSPPGSFSVSTSICMPKAVWKVQGYTTP